MYNKNDQENKIHNMFCHVSYNAKKPTTAHSSLQRFLSWERFADTSFNRIDAWTFTGSLHQLGLSDSRHSAVKLLTTFQLRDSVWSKSQLSDSSR